MLILFFSLQTLMFDDLVITCNDNKEVELFITHLCNEFKCKDLGILHFFLGIQVLHKFDGSVELNQSGAPPLSSMENM